MAPYRYHDSTSATSGDWNSTTNAAAYGTGCSSASSAASGYYYLPKPRRILVSTPEKWSEKDTLAFCDLVNKETRTGWIVEMVIRGDVIITDPDIETRTMEEFLPLLKNRASRSDVAKIEIFFKEHPIELAN